MAVAGGIARAGADDVYVVAPVHVALPAMRKFAVRLRDRLGLTVNSKPRPDGRPAKTQLYCPTEEAGRAAAQWVAGQGSPRDVAEFDAAMAPEGLKLDGLLFAPALVDGVQCYGVPVGSAAYVGAGINAKADAVVVFCVFVGRGYLCPSHSSQRSRR